MLFLIFPLVEVDHSICLVILSFIHFLIGHFMAKLLLIYIPIYYNYNIIKLIMEC